MRRLTGLVIVVTTSAGCVNYTASKATTIAGGVIGSVGIATTVAGVELDAPGVIGAGLGVMLLESPDGQVRTVEIGPRTMCYVPPFWIHRSVNVGSEPLVMTFAYPADSGQDYDIIANAGGMRSRIVDDGAGGWTAIDNKSYRPRPQSLVDSIMAMVD